MKRMLLLVLFFNLLNCAFEDPYFTIIETNANSNKIIIDNRFAKVSDIPVAIHNKIKDLDSVRKSKFYVKLKVEKGTTMGVIADIKYELRRINVLNICYY